MRVYSEECKRRCRKIETDETLTVSLDGKINLDEECKKAMNRLGERYDSLSGFYPNAKAVIASEGMSYMKILGMYAPFTIEANYNANAPDFAKPFTVCHELSHLKGFMREDEANFIAYLACTGSDNVYLQYAGWVYALIYAANALYSAAGAEIYSELMSYADNRIKAELKANSEYWKKYETPVATVATTVNDTYLKSQGQSDGKKSYGRFVDLMISYEKCRHRNSNVVRYYKYWSNQLMANKKLYKKERFSGCIVGAAAGDALGSPVKTLTRSHIKDLYGKKGILKLSPEKRQKTARISDETQMMLFTAHGILWADAAGLRTGEANCADYVFLALQQWLYSQTGGTSSIDLQWILDDNETGFPCDLLGISAFCKKRNPTKQLVQTLAGIKSENDYGRKRRPINQNKLFDCLPRAIPAGLYFTATLSLHSR